MCEERGQCHCACVTRQLAKKEHKAMQLVKSGNYTDVSKLWVGLPQQLCKKAEVCLHTGKTIGY